MTVEYSEGRQKNRRGAQAKRRRAYPIASAVRVTRADGTVELIPALKGGDKPGRYVGRWTAADTNNSGRS